MSEGQIFFFAIGTFFIVFFGLIYKSDKDWKDDGDE